MPSPLKIKKNNIKKYLYLSNRVKAIIKEGFDKLDLTTLDGFKIAGLAEQTSRKIVAQINKKKNKSGDGTRVKSSRKPVQPNTPQTRKKIIIIYYNI